MNHAIRAAYGFRISVLCAPFDCGPAKPRPRRLHHHPGRDDFVQSQV